MKQEAITEKNMQMTLKKIKLEDKEINYNLKCSKRARRMRLTIHCDGSLVATVPKKYSADVLENFIVEKSDWIIKKINYFKNFQGREFWKESLEDYEKYKVQALVLAEEKTRYFNQFFGFSCGKISIRNQKTRWGSCSANRNISFNYKIIFLPPHLVDYIIVHELCHLKEFNHSRAFWAQVEKVIPDYKKARKEIRKL